MRLTAIWQHIKTKRPHGHLWRGKHRKVREPSYRDLVQLRNDFEREEQNMLILRHPYLTEDQSHGHMTSLKTIPNYVEASRNMRNERFQKHFSWADQLCHLRVTDNWE